MDFTHGGNVYKVARERNIAIEKIIDFSANINPLGLSKLGNERLVNSLSGLLNYPDPDYVALKEEIGSFHSCHASSVYLGNGAIDLIFFLMRALSPKRAMILAPTFVEYERALLAAGSEVIPYYLKEESGFQVQVDHLLGQLVDIDCLVLCNPNNPTGQLIPRGTTEKIIRYCNQHGIALVLDEAFMDFVDMEEIESCIPLLETYKDLFILRSITKFFAVPGLRLGYLLTHNQALSTFYSENKEPWCVNHFAQEYTIAALRDRPYIKASKEFVIKERLRVVEALDEIESISSYHSFGNYIFFKYDGSNDIKELLEKEGLLIRSCHNYRGLTDAYFRIAVKTENENNQLIDKLKGIENV